MLMYVGPHADTLPLTTGKERSYACTCPANTTSTSAAARRGSMAACIASISPWCASCGDELMSHVSSALAGAGAMRSIEGSGGVSARVAVVPRRVQHDHQPRGPAPRHPRQVLLEPVVLRGGRGEGGIAAEEGEVHARRLEGVEQRGGGPARLVRHPVPREVALEEGEPRGALHLMISVGRHPRDLSSYGLQEARVRVPTRLEVVGVAQVAHVEDDVGPARPQVLEGRHRV
mmetsp:Transcript_1242/g.5057  ORF Transcript_1242/g.5057 Transcript_1242/m.5057 type:complete len:231 (-) Transcript_1242:1699-2391(-)